MRALRVWVFILGALVTAAVAGAASPLPFADTARGSPRTQIEEIRQSTEGCGPVEVGEADPVTGVVLCP